MKQNDVKMAFAFSHRFLWDVFVMSYSDLFRVSMDPRVTPVGDKRKKDAVGDERKKELVGDGIKNVIARNMFTCDVAISAK